MNVILTLILLALIVVACGMLVERYLLRGPRVVMGQLAEDTCENHGVWLCEECFPLDEWGIPTARPVLEVHHLCGDPRCMEIDHLQIVQRNR